MARLWSSGFELQSAVALMEYDNASSSAPTISTSIKRSGLASMRFNPSSNVKYVTKQYNATIGAGNRFFVRFYMYVATLPAADTMIWANCSALVSPGRTPRLFLKATGKLGIAEGSGSTHTYKGTESGVLSLNTWYRIEVDYNGASADATTVYLDGVDVTGSIQGGDGTFNTAGCCRFGAFTDVEAGSTSCDLYIDDIAINDTAGSDQNGLPGAGSIVHLLPNAAGDLNTWQTSAGGAGSSTNFQAVDEATPPDDATTYLKRIATTIKNDDYNVDSSASAGIGSGDAVTLVEVGIRGGAISATASTDRDVLLRIKGQASGTVVKSANSTNRLNINGWTTHSAAKPQTSKLVRYTNPQGNVAWTPAALDTMQIGVENQTSVTTEVRVSSLWALVEYVPATTIFHNLGLITVTDTPQAVTRIKQRALGLGSSTEVAQAATRRKLRSLGLAASTEAAQTMGRLKSRALGLASETDTAQAIAHYKARPLGLVTETDAPQAMTRIKLRSIGLNTETDSPQTLRPSKLKLLGLITETETAQAITRIKLHSLGLITEAEAAQGITRRKLRSIALVLSSEVAQPMTHVKLRPLGLITSTDAAQALTRLKLRQLGLVTELEVAQAIVWHKELRLGLIIETEIPRSITSFVVLFKDITVEIGPSRLRNIASILPARQSWTLAQARTFWAVVDTVLREHASVEESRSATEATPGASRLSTDIGNTRLGWEVEESRNDREE